MRGTQVMPENEGSQVAIFWDYENCRPPSHLSGYNLVDNIRRLVRASGPVKTFKAYVDTSLECGNSRSLALHSELQSSGVTLVHCPHNGKKDVTDKMMIVDMLAFAIDNQSPATIAIITGDKDFAYAAAVLRLRGYKVVILCHNAAHTSLKMQADVLFDWQNIVGSAIFRDNTADQSMLLVTSPRTVVASDATNYATNTATRPQWTRSEASTSQELSKAVICRRFATLPPEPVGNPQAIQTKSDAHRTSGLQANDAFQTKSVLHSVTGVNQRGNSRIGSDTSITFHTNPSLNDPQYCYAINYRDFNRPQTGDRSDSSMSISFNTQDYLSGENSTETYCDSTSESSANILSDRLSPNVSVLIPTASGVVDLSSMRRFETLIEFFCEQQDATQRTEICSSPVATEILKRNPAVYENAGVSKMKEYVEEARLANVIVSPGMDHVGFCMVKINSALYDVFKCYKAGILPLEGSEGTGHAPKKAIIVVDPVFKPLINRLRTYSHPVPYSTLESVFTAEHPYLYECAEVQTLSQYLQEAKEEGIVRLLNDHISGQKCVELVPELREYESVSFA